MADEIETEAQADGQPMSTADFAQAGKSPPQTPDTMVAEQSSDRPEPSGTLLPDTETGDLRRQWDTIQTGFVDEPRRAVEQADELVAGAMKRLAEIFATERGQLESQWDRGDDVSTEGLRIALQRYRTFFERLLSI